MGRNQVRSGLVPKTIPLAVGLLIVTLTLQIMSLRNYPERLAVASEVIGDDATRITGELTGPATVAQGFRATAPNLTRVDLLLSNYTRPNRSPLWLKIRDAESDQLLRISVAPSRSVGDNQNHSFLFQPIANSAGRRLIMELSSPEAEPGHSVTAWVDDSNPYLHGRAYINDVPKRSFDLVLTLRYRANVHSALDELVNRTSQYKPWFFKTSALRMLSIIAFVVTLLAVGAVTRSVLRYEHAAAPTRSNDAS